MNYFAWQRTAMGAAPVAFDERPDLRRGLARHVIEGTVIEIPEALREAALGELASWAIRRHEPLQCPIPVFPEVST